MAEPMKTRAVFYMFGGNGFLDVAPHLRDFANSGVGFTGMVYESFCPSGFTSVTGIRIPRKGLFKATLILKRIKARRPR